jgi:thiaminase (transcriptional activator TenA)
MVSAEENTFFPLAFEALGVTEDRRTADPDTQATAGGDMAGYGRRSR